MPIVASKFGYDADIQSYPNILNSSCPDDLSEALVVAPWPRPCSHVAQKKTGASRRRPGVAATLGHPEEEGEVIKGGSDVGVCD